MESGRWENFNIPVTFSVKRDCKSDEIHQSKKPFLNISGKHVQSYEGKVSNQKNVAIFCD